MNTLSDPSPFQQVSKFKKSQYVKIISAMDKGQKANILS